MQRGSVHLIVGIIIIFIFINLMGQLSTTIYSSSSINSVVSSKSMISKKQEGFNKIDKAPYPLYKKWRKCIDNHLSVYLDNPESLWEHLPNVSLTCDNTLSSLKIQSFDNKDETKFHIYPYWPNTRSVLLSLGIGLDVTAEEKLKEVLYNTSIFYGADPMLENAALFSSIGPFFPFAVGAKSGFSTASVLEDGFYVNKVVLHVNIIYLIKEFLPSGEIFFDNMWIDAESAEYELFPFFYKEGQFDINNITICQFNMEIHDPSLSQKEEYQLFIKQILADHRYVFLRILSVNPHHRTYFLNFQDERCIDRYIKTTQ